MTNIFEICKALLHAGERETRIVFADPEISESDFYRRAALEIQESSAARSNVSPSQAKEVKSTPMATIVQTEQEAVKDVVVSKIVQKTLNRGEFREFMKKNPTRDEITKWLEDNAI